MTLIGWKNKIRFLIPALLIAGILVYLFLTNNFFKPAENSRRELALKKETSAFSVNVPYNWPLFYTVLEKQAAQEKLENNKQERLKAMAAIAPHHDLAAQYVAELFSKLSNPEIKTVIVVGPNHENVGATDVVTGVIDYQLLDGELATDADWVDWLEQEKLANIEPERFSNEHSIYALAPFVKYYFPEARIVPLILKSSLSPAEAQRLGEVLADKIKSSNNEDNTLVIGSIDFSHYLPTEQANLKDAETRQALLARDYSRLYSFGNDNIDSPMTATVVLTAATRLGGDKTEIVANVNQAEATGLVSVPSSTSYFTVVLGRENAGN